MNILNFIAGPWGALIGKVLMAASLAGMIYVAISQYNHHIAEGQMLRDQNAQLVQLQKDNQEMNQKLGDLSNINNDILLKLDQKNGRVIGTHDKVTTYIQSPEGQKSNRPTSDIIKNTIGMLKNDE